MPYVNIIYNCTEFWNGAAAAISAAPMYNTGVCAIGDRPVVSVGCLLCAGCWSSIIGDSNRRCRHTRSVRVRSKKRHIRVCDLRDDGQYSAAHARTLCMNNADDFDSRSQYAIRDGTVTRDMGALWCARGVRLRRGIANSELSSPHCLPESHVQ